MDNVIDSFAERLEKGRIELSEAKVQLDNAKAEMEAPFTKEEELEDKRA